MKAFALCSCLAFFACNGAAQPGEATGPSNGGTTGATTGTATSGAPCQDGDGDGFGLDCPAGPDCNPDSADHWEDCSLCVDNDGDVRGEACDRGGDCDDNNGRTWGSCETCLDGDNDQHWTGCEVADATGDDCNDGDAATYQLLTGFTDSDGDGYALEEVAITICSGAALPAGAIATSLGVDCDDGNDDYNGDTVPCPATPLGNLNTGSDFGADGLDPKFFVNVSNTVALPARASVAAAPLPLPSSVLFAARDDANGTELFRVSSGATATMSIVRDLVPGPSGATISNAMEFNSGAMFAIDDKIHGSELWKYDNASGLKLVADQTPGSASTAMTFLGGGGNNPFYFLTTPNVLKKSDGATISTVSGTPPSGADLQDIAYSTGGIYFAHYERIDNQIGVYRSYAGGALSRISFTGLNNNSGRALQFLKVSSSRLYVLVKEYTLADTEIGYFVWKIGTGAGGDTATRVCDEEYYGITPGGTGAPDLQGGQIGSALFTTFCPNDSNCELYKTNGNDWQLVKDIMPGSSGSNPSNYVACGGYLYFKANDGTNGRELWRSNGTAAGTVMVKNINAGSGSSDPTNPVCSGTKLFFQANDGNGSRLWATDTGTHATLATSISYTGTPIAYAGGLLFAADDGGDGPELWFSGGSSISTKKVRELSHPRGSNIASFFNHTGSAVFAATANNFGNELWVTDGTAGNTRRLNDAANGAADSNPKGFTTLGSLLLYTATSLAGEELWASDLTSNGTHLVKDIHPSGSASPNRLRVHGGKLFFGATDPVNGREPWMTDGTELGTQMLGDLNPGAADSAPQNFTTFGTKLFFSATTATSGTEPWSTPLATPLTTPMLFSDIDAAGNSAATSFTVADGRLYFVAKDATSGLELRRVNDAGTGVVLVKDIYPNAPDSTPSALKVHDDKLFFTANDGVDGALPWVVNAGGTDAIELKGAETPNNPSNYTSSGTTLFFFAESTGHGKELWKTDGTAVGTVRISEIGAGAAEGGFALISNALNPFDGGVLFFAKGTQGMELWRSTGTMATLVKDINPGVWPSYAGDPTILQVKPGVAVFAAATPANGVELWRTDGTPAGTYMVQDLTGDAASSNPRKLTLIDDYVLFIAEVGNSGPEPWAMAIDGL